MSHNVSYFVILERLDYLHNSTKVQYLNLYSTLKQIAYRPNTFHLHNRVKFYSIKCTVGIWCIFQLHTFYLCTCKFCIITVIDTSMLIVSVVHWRNCYKRKLFISCLEIYKSRLNAGGKFKRFLIWCRFNSGSTCTSRNQYFLKICSVVIV